MVFVRHEDGAQKARQYWRMQKSKNSQATDGLGGGVISVHFLKYFIKGI